MKLILEDCSKRADRIAEFLPDAFAVLFCAIAFGVAHQTTSGLSWPCELDFFRDMGAAQAFLNGEFASDAAYLGETRWYNPLVPVLAALISQVSGLSLATFYAQAGVYLNLLGPIAFYILLRSTLGAKGSRAQTGRLAALAGLAAFLFLGSTSQPSWTHATYSPWLWPMNFAQALAYATIALYFAALRRKQEPRAMLWNIATGVMLGLTILAHTAPGLIITLLILGTCLGTAARTPSDRRESLLRLVVIGSISALVASPFLGPLLLEYRFSVANPEPSNYVGINLSEIAKGMFSIRAIVALLGAVLLTQSWARREWKSSQLRDGLWIILAVLVPLAYGMTSQLFAGRIESVSLPLIVPTFHFHFYFKAVESALFGIAVGLLLHRALDRPTQPLRSSLAACALLTALVLAALPSYRGRHDLVHYRSEAKSFAATPEVTELHAWLAENTKPEDVVLGEIQPSLVAVAAGRKVVAVNAFYSNPFVDWEARRRDQIAMLEAFRAGEFQRLAPLSERYQLRYVVLDDLDRRACCAWSRSPESGQPPLRFSTSSGRLRIYELPEALGQHSRREGG